MDVGWVIVWRHLPLVTRFLRHVGFTRAYHVGAVVVYRPVRGGPPGGT
jgi:hypothetical protein